MKVEEPPPGQIEERPPGKKVRRMPPGGVLAVAVILGLFLYAVQTALLPFVIAMAVAYAANPLILWIMARTGLHRAVPAMIVFVLLLGLVLLIGWLGAPGLIAEGKLLVTDFQGTVESAIRGFMGEGTISLLGTETDPQQLAAAATAEARDWLGQAGQLLSLATISFAVVFGFFLTLVLLAYFLLGLPGIARGMLRMVPPEQRPTVLFVWSRIDPVLSRYFIGLAVVVTYTSTAAYLGLGFFLQLPHALLLALLTGFLELIPVVGPAASAVLAGVVALQNATSFWAIGLYIIYAALLRLSVDQFVGPIVLGRAAYIPPVLVIFCFLAGGLLFGIPGVILAVPVALTIRIVAATLYGEGEDLEEKEERE